MKVRVLLAAIALSTGSLGAEQRLTIRVSPVVAFAPANLLVRTQVQADHANRFIEVVAESPEFYRSSETQLDGERAPRTSVFEFRGLPRGTYQVRAVLKGVNGDRLAFDQASVEIIDSEPVRR
jgi:hypothetical protein